MGTRREAWAGRDNGALTEPALSPKKTARKRGAGIGCTSREASRTAEAVLAQAFT